MKVCLPSKIYDFMQIPAILQNWKFTYKRNSREYICVNKENIYIYNSSP